MHNFPSLPKPMRGSSTQPRGAKHTKNIHRLTGMTAENDPGQGSSAQKSTATTSTPATATTTAMLQLLLQHKHDGAKEQTSLAINQKTACMYRPGGRMPQRVACVDPPARLITRTGVQARGSEGQGGAGRRAGAAPH